MSALQHMSTVLALQHLHKQPGAMQKGGIRVTMGGSCGLQVSSLAPLLGSDHDASLKCICALIRFS